MQSSQSAKPLPDIYIGTEKVHAMIEKYEKEKYPLLQATQKAKDTNRNETKSVWYSKEHIQTWLSEMELMNADGMRVYFGAYDENHHIAPGQQCLVVMLTRADKNGNQDIVYENETNFEARLNATKNPRSTILEDKIVPKPFNYGSPCPPIC